MKIYDFIIIGAGPAGLRTAGLLANAGFSILIIEKDIIAGKPRSWITWLDDITALGYGEAVKNRINAIRFRSFLGGEYRFGKAVSAVMDCAKLLSILKNQAQSKSAAVSEKEVLIRYKTNTDHVEIQTNRDTYKSKYCVDASGCNSVIQSGLGGDLAKSSFMGCYAYEISGINVSEPSEAVIFDAAFPGKDYFWFVPYSENEALVGCFFFEQLDGSTVGRARESLEKYIKFFNAGGSAKSLVAGNIPIAGRNYLNHEKIFFTGDSSSSPLPSSGYGLLRAFKEAEILANSLIKGFKTGKFSYEKDILEDRYPGYEVHLLVSDILKNINDPLLNKAIAKMNTGGEDFISNFLKGDDLSTAFSAQALVAIFNTFTIQEIASMAIRRDYKELLFHFARTYPKATSSILKKELKTLFKKLIWQKENKKI